MTVHLGPLVGVSQNCWFPGFGSTQREAASWNVRLPELAARIRAQKPAIIGLQEAGQQSVGGQALAVVERVGPTYEMQAFGLNAVAWDKTIFDYESTQEIGLPDFGQRVPGLAGTGRTCISVKLRSKRTGKRLKIASTHLAVKGSTLSAADARSARLAQAKKVASTINDDENDYPTILMMDSNTRLIDPGKTALTVFKEYGWRWPLTGSIDRIMGNFGAELTGTIRSVDQGRASDHDLRRFTFQTNRP